MSYDVLKIICYVVDFLIVLQIITSAVMCLYGYKWSKGLIAIMSTYIGFTLGGIIAYFLLNIGVGYGCLWIVPICTISFAISAYTVVWINHFSAGYLVVIKICYMILYTLMDNGVMDTNITFLLIMPLVIGFVAGIIICAVYNNYVVIMCLSFIGATELIPKLFDLINKTLFVATGDIGFIFDPIDFILEIFGIDTISLWEVIGILVVFVLSFIWQRKLMIDNGIDLSGVTIDDRNYEKE